MGLVGHHPDGEGARVPRGFHLIIPVRTHRQRPQRAREEEQNEEGPSCPARSLTEDAIHASLTAEELHVKVASSSGWIVPLQAEIAYS